jgi:hypothetical protein
MHDQDAPLFATGPRAARGSRERVGMNPALPGLRTAAAIGTAALAPSAAQAHVKWFAPYIVGAPPQPLAVTLGNVWFWTGIGLVLVFFIATRPLSALGLIALWGLALTEYDAFHLLDYLSLGLAVAGYLVLDACSEKWRKYRFEVLRWGVAIALMWSSLEKFAYPDWFYPLVEEKPFLTFGMPRDVFIPMAGVAEFTMGFGLLWTALVRRLSAITLFIIFNAAVYPFGRIDLVGHALIMAVIVAIAVDPTKQVRFAIRRAAWAIPLTLGAALVVFATAYWGLHHAVYGVAGDLSRPAAKSQSTHSFDPDHPHEVDAKPSGTGIPAAAPGAAGTPGSGHTHGAPPSRLQPATAEFEAAMERMHTPMTQGIRHADPDVAFVLGMLPHHQGALDMARTQLRYGADPHIRHLAQEVIAAQEREISEMKAWLALRGIEVPARAEQK